MQQGIQQGDILYAKREVKDELIIRYLQKQLK
jgi:hypothetical protein